MITKRLRWSTISIRTQILVPAILMLTVIVFVLSVIMTRSFTNQMYKQEDNRFQYCFSLTDNAICTMLENNRLISKGLLQDKVIENYLINSFKSDSEMIQSRIQTLNVLQNALIQNPSLHGIIFLREDGSAFGTFPSRNIFYDEPSTSFLNEKLLDSIYNTKVSGWVGPISGEDLYRLEISKRYPSQYIIGVSVYNSIYYGKAYALSIISTDILTPYLAMLSEGRSNIYLLNSQNEVLSSVNESMLPYEETIELIRSNNQLYGARISIDEKKEYIYVNCYNINSLGWHLVRELPTNDYELAVKQIRNLIWESAGLLFIIALVFYLLWFKRFIRAFDDLKKAIVTIQYGEIGTRITNRYRTKELEIIRQEFNKMNQSILKLISETKKLEHHQLELEMKYLQTQLSPHMIFNSITAIRWMATMAGADRVSDMLIELSEMLRPVFRDWKIEWTLEEELTHLTHYARLLDLRYGNHFCMECDIPDDMMLLRIPRFTIQPLVENACEHGSIDNKGMIVCIRGYLSDDMATIIVKDNGSGMSAETLIRVRENLENKNQPDNIGLSNVYNRLRICLGDDSTLFVNSEMGKGTEITIQWKVIY